MPDDNLIDTSKQDKKKTQAERKRERELSDIRVQLKTPEGRRIYWESIYGVFLDPVAYDLNGCVDIEKTFLNLGLLRSARNKLFDLMEAKPEAFSQMQQEHASELKRIENEQKDEIKEGGDPLSLS